MYCKICGEYRYNKMDLRTIFRTSEFHNHCESLLQKSSNLEVIPITNNELHFYSFFDEKEDLNYDYLYTKMMIKLLDSMTKNNDSNLIFMYEEEEFNQYNSEVITLLLNLSNKPIQFISMFAY